MTNGYICIRLGAHVQLNFSKESEFRLASLDSKTCNTPIHAALSMVH